MLCISNTNWLHCVLIVKDQEVGVLIPALAAAISPVYKTSLRVMVSESSPSHVMKNDSFMCCRGWDLGDR